MIKIRRLLSLLAFVSLFNLPIISMAEETKKYELATFAGGCFWCMQPPFDNTDGVIDTSVGYSGGEEKDANYESVSSKATKHIEVIQVKYNPEIVSYDELLDVYIKNIDPVDPKGQFADKGPQYLAAILYHNNSQKLKAENLLKKLNNDDKFKGKVATYIEEYKNFFPAEDYHQDYYKKNPVRYNAYKYGSGRVYRLKEIWGE